MDMRQNRSATWITSDCDRASQPVSCCSYPTTTRGPAEFCRKLDRGDRAAVRALPGCSPARLCQRSDFVDAQGAVSLCAGAKSAGILMCLPWSAVQATEPPCCGRAIDGLVGPGSTTQAADRVYSMPRQGMTGQCRRRGKDSGVPGRNGLGTQGTATTDRKQEVRR